MGQWDDKFKRHAEKWASWEMQEYAQHDRVLPKIIEDKARQYPDHVVFQFRDDPITLGELNENINRIANGFLSLGVKHGDKVAIIDGQHGAEFTLVDDEVGRAAGNRASDAGDFLAQEEFDRAR